MILFYEDNKIGKIRFWVLFIILAVCFFGWTLGFIMGIIVPLPVENDNNLIINRTIDNVVSIVFLTALLGFLIFLLIYYRKKSINFQQTLTITENEIILNIPIKGENHFKLNELLSCKIITKIGDSAILNFIFSNSIVVEIKTRKFEQLGNLLNLLKKDNLINL